MMDSGRLEDYVDQVYNYALKHTYSREESDELSQEILFEAVRALPKLKDDGKFEPWLWGIAHNVTKSYRRHMGKQRAMYFYDVPNDLVYEESDDDAEELYALLREKIPMLSAAYRDIIIFYYYDNLSVKEISRRMKIPEGTVTRRLAEGRRKLKKECTEMEETALRPIKMNLDIYGSGHYDGKLFPFPSVYIDDALSQNILFYCYEAAHGVEELAKLCGTPAYYIEDRMENLLRRGAIIEAPKGKYRTDFIIWEDRHAIYGEENAEKILLPMQELRARRMNIPWRAAQSSRCYHQEPHM